MAAHSFRGEVLGPAQRGLGATGWSVQQQPMPVEWTAAVEQIADGEVVLVDGLVAGPALVQHARGLRLVVLLHMPLGHREEREVLSAAAAVVTTSAWSRR